jgi:dipeptidyl aminopeptidase/acylaminoacyl peptidase
MPGMRHAALLPAIVLSAVLVPWPSAAQGTVDDYRRAMELRDRYDGLAVHTTDTPRFIQDTNRFYYRKAVKGGHEFILVDPDAAAKQPAFDHEKLAASLSAAAKDKYTAIELPFNAFTFVDGEKAITFTIGQAPWRCTLGDYTCRPNDRAGGGRGGRGGGGLAGPVRREFEINGTEPVKSPDGKWEALVRNYNVAVREEGTREVTLLSTDGSEGSYYDPLSIAWSPDSTKIAVYKVKPGHRRYVHYVESSPEDQLQPKHSTLQYAKPGDVLDVELPVLFDVASKTRTAVDTALFPNAYTQSRLQWRRDSSAFTFDYNQRGHQVFRIIEVNASTGAARAVVSEETKTFFHYSGKRFRHDVDDGKEVIWMSERDGWNHLYLYDGATGRVKHQITRGEWPVRSVVKVDEDARQIWFSASGMYPGKDPYFVHYYRIDFDGTGLTTFTQADANHNVVFSPDMKYYVNVWSRVDLSPSLDVRRTADNSLVMELERADISALEAAGWTPPEVFTAKGRDGVTDIWGVIYRPTNFSPDRTYPVIENIYAGPHSSFVPKSFGAFNQMQATAELGFIVVQIDGMGTSNRSKAFHDVAWQNLKDAGFPDRILWHKAVAAKYPYYDITRVGIYGTSAGGQSAMGALLFHGDFYTAAFSAAGCHDNRMDKIWWNEQWMGYPIGDHYSASSNVDNSHLLEGALLLVVGEMDMNVDPASTMQVVNALIKAKKNFDLLVIPGAGHTAGGAYGDHKRYDFFVKNLLGMDPPAWRLLEEKRTTETTASRQ